MAKPATTATIRAVFCGAVVYCAACGPAGEYIPPGFSPAEAAWEGHHEKERAGELEAAAEGYRVLCTAQPDFTRACYDRVRVLFESGRAAEARREAVAFVIAHPDHALAQAAVKHLAGSFVENGETDAGIAALGDVASSTRGRDVWDSAMYELARMHRGRADAENEAGALTKIVGQGRWGSQLWDNAIWRLIELASERDDRAEEKRLLEKLIAAREDSHIIASYDSHYHDDALLRLGRLLLDEGDLERARAAFMELAGWKSSRASDDGLYWAAVVRMRQGRAKEACALLRVVVVEMPWSNSVDDAEGLMREARCAGADGGRTEAQ